MKTTEVIAKFGTQAAAARAAGVSAPSLSNWAEYPPPARQLAIEVVTQGALLAEPGCLGKVFGLEHMTDADIVLSLARSVGIALPAEEPPQG